MSEPVSAGFIVVLRRLFCSELLFRGGIEFPRTLQTATPNWLTDSVERRHQCCNFESNPTLF